MNISTKLNTSKKILIIEDEKSISNSLIERLSNEGFSVINSNNGEDGLKIALDQKPDLILLDIILPKMDGLTMLEKLREDDWGKNAEVIMLTNLDDVRKINEALEKGAFDYLIKSDCELNEIIEKIKKKLNI